MRHRLYVIECRTNGTLDFAGLQPEQVFGHAAITGISEDQMAKTVFARCPDAVLTGMDIPNWPSHIDPRWTARVRTW